MPGQRLIVEGKDDVHVIWHVLQRSVLSTHIKTGAEKANEETPNGEGIYVASPVSTSTDESGGWRSLVDLARIGEIFVGRWSALGFVVDSDSPNHSSRPWPALREALRKTWKDIPDEVPVDGLVLSATGGLPRLGVWVMPSPGSTGNIEDFLLASLPADEPRLKLAIRVVDTDLRALNPDDMTFDTLRAKRLAHTWLAWSQSPGRPLGLAVKANLFPIDSAAVKAFTGWARQLFEVPVLGPA